MQALIRVSGTSPTTNATIKIELPRYKGIAEDYHNIRFRTITGQVIPHWVEDTSKGIIWVKLPRIGEAGATFYVEWGNWNSGRGNGLDTFLFFDDLSSTDGWSTEEFTIDTSNHYINVPLVIGGYARKQILLNTNHFIWRYSISAPLSYHDGYLTRWALSDTQINSSSSPSDTWCIGQNVYEGKYYQSFVEDNGSIQDTFLSFEYIHNKIYNVVAKFNHGIFELEFYDNESLVTSGNCTLSEEDVQFNWISAVGKAFVYPPQNLYIGASECRIYAPIMIYKYLDPEPEVLDIRPIPSIKEIIPFLITPGKPFMIIYLVSIASLKLSKSRLTLLQ